MIKFQCPDHTLDIIGVNGICGRRIDFTQHVVQIVCTFFCRKLF